MIPAVLSRIGLARSLVIYRARPWVIPRLARFYRGIVGPGDLAFDIGAHVGSRTRALLAAGARVVAVEPQALFRDFLRRDLPPGAVLVEAAVGAEPGSARLAVSRLHPTVSSLAPGFAARMAAAPGFARVRWDAEETVAVVTLDALIAAHGRPRFVKIDVEGHEAEVLAGLSQPVPVIAFEALPAAPAVACAALARLAELGDYRFNLVAGERPAFALSDWQSAEGIRAALETQAARGRPGDVYARLADA